MTPDNKKAVTDEDWAELLAKRVKNGYYEKDGGFIDDWFLHDVRLIQQAVRESERAKHKAFIIRALTPPATETK